MRMEAERLAQGLACEEVARRIGLSLQGYRQIRKGITRTPRPATARALEDLFGLPVEVLLLETGEVAR